MQLRTIDKCTDLPYQQAMSCVKSPVEEAIFVFVCLDQKRTSIPKWRMFSLGTLSTVNIPDGFSVCCPVYGWAGHTIFGHARVCSMSDYKFWERVIRTPF